MVGGLGQEGVACLWSWDASLGRSPQTQSWKERRRQSLEQQEQRTPQVSLLRAEHTAGQSKACRQGDGRRAPGRGLPQTHERTQL